ncbi:hypothetical protein DERF_001194 [Dermatophagoides farinae]|uniref:Uncharacterized protein n=1 Tax=Dermatophagoides farinae TaxID=6954 RepID=A0A922L952_DERFA|nr:hypothetical protein DERF_001194 [Dermatophagoides farinae]
MVMRQTKAAATIVLAYPRTFDCTGNDRIVLGHATKYESGNDHIDSSSYAIFHRSGDDRIAMDIRQTRKVATIALNQWRHSTRLATIAPSENGRQSMTEATIALNQ